MFKQSTEMICKRAEQGNKLCRSFATWQKARYQDFPTILYLSLCLSAFLLAHPLLSVSLSIHPLAHLSVCLSVCLVRYLVGGHRITLSDTQTSALCTLIITGTKKVIAFFYNFGAQ